MSFEYETKLSGPVFDGKLTRAVPGFLDKASHDVARHGQDIVWHAGKGSIQEWTGNWGSHLATERRQDGWVSHDSGIVYGPWLEGTGSRNRTTRFKGYRMWRRAIQELRKKQQGIVVRSLRDSVLGRLLGR